MKVERASIPGNEFLHVWDLQTAGTQTPAYIDFGEVNPDFYSRRFIWAYNARIGTVNGIEGYLLFSRAGMPLLKLPFGASGVVVAADSFTSFGQFYAIPNDFGAWMQFQNQGNPTRASWYSLVLGCDRVEFYRTRQIGADGNQRVHWNFLFWSQQIIRGKSPCNRPEFIA